MTQMVLLLVLFASVALGQTVTENMISEQAAFAASSPALSITATQGNGDSCVINKLAGASIKFSFTCSSSDAAANYRSGQITATGTTVSRGGLMWGDITCLIIMNPTATANTQGSVGPAPAKGIAWSCTTNTTGGNPTPPQSGSIAWP